MTRRQYAAGDRITVQLDALSADAVNLGMKHAEDWPDSVTGVVISALKRGRAVTINRDRWRADKGGGLTPAYRLELPICEWPEEWTSAS